jgi:hypothetical protein
MRAPLPPPDIDLIAAQIEVAPEIDRVRALNPGFAAADPDTVAAILEEAAKFAHVQLAPLNDVGDRVGCEIVDGRVRTAPGHRAAWASYVEGGWPALDHPEADGGQGLPLVVAMAVQEVMDRSCSGFGMLPVPQRSAAKLIAAHGDEALQREWLPQLVSGEWGATICISEPGAGSDVMRLRTTARRLDERRFAITGEKTWISYGDHDLTPRIGHCLLARTPGVDGLSLFLVPDTIVDAEGTMRRNTVFVRRVEEKLGLHVSPTCAMGFEEAEGWLIGTEGRGLAQMFVMITNMRLSVGAQGLGIAAGAADAATSYAAERLQGGGGDAPVAIVHHRDVQRMVAGMHARVEMLRGLVLAIATHADLARYEPDEALREDAAALTQWLLPIVKTTGGEYAWAVADEAIQIFGGAGYTRDWPVEQALRDARVLTIYEGTTGIQALDLLHRRLRRGDRRGYRCFLAAARMAAARCPAAVVAPFGRCLDLLEQAVADMTAAPAAEGEIGATALLHLAALAATGWIAARFAALASGSAQQDRLAALGAHWLADIDARAMTFVGALRAPHLNRAMHAIRR